MNNNIVDNNQLIKDALVNIEEELGINLFSNKDQVFSGKLLVSAFHQCTIKSNEKLENHDDISIREYLIAYNEVIKFLEKLGAIFYFVVADIREKIEILEQHIHEKPEHYQTIQKMIEFEKRENHLLKKNEKPNNGARTILRLHRALLFIYKFLNNLYASNPASSSSDICVNAYDETLAQYHTWLVKKAAILGMRMIPNREVVIGYMSQDEAEIHKFPIYFTRIINVYNITQDIYATHQILDLP